MSPDRSALDQQSLALIRYALSLLKQDDGDALREALTILYDQYSETLNRYAKARLRSNTVPVVDVSIDSEDIVQDVWHSVLLHHESVSQVEPEKLLGYLLAMTRNKVWNYWRSAGHEARLSPETHSHTILGSNEPPVDRTVLAMIDLDAVLDALEYLPISSREVMRLYLEGRSTAQIATELELSPQTVRQRLSRGRKLLRPWLT